MKIRIVDLMDHYYGEEGARLAASRRVGKHSEPELKAVPKARHSFKKPLYIAASIILAVELIGVLVWCFGPGSPANRTGVVGEGESVSEHSEHFGIPVTSPEVSSIPEPQDSSAETSSEDPPAEAATLDEADTLFHQMWEAGKFNIEHAATYIDEVYGFRMVLPKKYEGDLLCNDGEKNAFRFVDGVTRQIPEYAEGGRIFSVDVHDRAEFYAEYQMEAGEWLELVSPNGIMLGRTESYVLVLNRPTDVQYDWEDQESVNSYRKHQITGYVMLKDFLDRNGIEANPTWEEAYCNGQVQRYLYELLGLREGSAQWDFGSLSVSAMPESDQLTWAIGDTSDSYSLPESYSDLSEQEKEQYALRVRGAYRAGWVYLFLPGIREDEPGQLAISTGDGEPWQEWSVPAPDYKTLVMTDMGTAGEDFCWIVWQEDLGSDQFEKYLCVSSDGGASWEKRSMEELGIVSSSDSICLADFLSPEQGFLTVTTGSYSVLSQLYTTSDGGKTWNACEVNYSGKDEVSVEIRKIFRTDDALVMTLLLSGTDRMKILYSYDEGLTWSEDPGGT